MQSRFQPVWRKGEPLRLTYLIRGRIEGLRLMLDETPFMASMSDTSAEIIVPAELYTLFRDGVRVALQSATSAGWESVANGFLVKEA